MTITDKRLIGANDQINNLMPLKYPWAWGMMKDSLKNFWVPEEIPMGGDKECYIHSLLPTEQEMFLDVFATLTTSDIVILRNVAMDIMQHITAPEVTAYLVRQIAEEGVHTVSYQHCIEVLGLDQDELYTRYLRIPEVKAKFDYAEEWAAKIFKFETLDDLAHGLIFYYACFEGLWFYNGFSPIYSLQRRNLMTGTGEQLQYIQRDESNHVAFGIRLIRELCKEERYYMDRGAIERIFREAIQLESDYAHRVMPNVLGYNAGLHVEQTKFLANRRLRQLGLEPIFEAECVLPWLDEQINIKKEKNFFETRVTEYQKSSALEGTWE